MKKLISIALSAALLAALLTGCGNSSTPNSSAPAGSKVEASLEELMTALTTAVPVEFMGGQIPVDVTDTSEEGLWALKSYTGLDSAEDISEALVFEPMMGSLAYSLVLVRVAENSDPETVAKAMQAGIDPRKWVCVEADDVKLAGYGDVVMLIMLESETGLTSQAYVDAFKEAVGAEPSFIL